MALRQDVTHYRGAKKSWAVNLVATATDSGSIAGRTYRVRVRMGNLAPVIELVTPTEITITDGVQRLLSINLTAAKANIEPGLYSWSLARTNAGDEDALIAGTWECLTWAETP